ncbi:porin [Shimia thalassica]|uniref:porin n=1 Tax=Shimia thalassica TaxID=1715693 RepID=UPI00249460CD|nr:porin [Shimia thalassica]
MNGIFKGPIAGLLVAMVASSAVAQNSEKRYPDQEAATFEAYGLLNGGVVGFDDGVDTYSKAVDNGHAPSRLGFWVRQPFYGSNLAFNFETAIGLRPSSGVNQVASLDNFAWDRRKIRKVEFILKTDRAGTFYLGQGSVSTDGAAMNDLSGTSLAQGSGIGDMAGAYLFRNSAGSLTARAIGTTMPNFDGGRRLRVRYDTPEVAGFSLSASYGEEVLAYNADFTTQNAALRYGKKVGAFKMKGALGYAKVELAAGAERHDTIGSFSVLHDSGWNLSLSAGDREESGDYTYGKVGYRANWWSIGESAVSVDYYAGNDMSIATSSQSEAWGLAFVQNVKKHNVQLYAAYRRYSLSEPGTTYQDASSYMLGAAWRF